MRVAKYKEESMGYFLWQAFEAALDEGHPVVINDMKNLVHKEMRRMVANAKAIHNGDVKVREDLIVVSDEEGE